MSNVITMPNSLEELRKECSALASAYASVKFCDTATQAQVEKAAQELSDKLEEYNTTRLHANYDRFLTRSNPVHDMCKAASYAVLGSRVAMKDKTVLLTDRTQRYRVSAFLTYAKSKDVTIDNAQAIHDAITQATSAMAQYVETTITNEEVPGVGVNAVKKAFCAFLNAAGMPDVKVDSRDVRFVAYCVTQAAPTLAKLREIKDSKVEMHMMDLVYAKLNGLPYGFQQKNDKK